MEATIKRTQRVHIEDSYEDVILSPEDDRRVRVLAALQVLKLKVYPIEKVLALYNLKESDLQVAS